MSSLETPSAFAMEDVRRTVLDNGLVVLAREVHTSPIVTAMIWYRVGSRNEELGQTGKSHFLEHMLFKGTERFKKGQIDLITLKNGGGNNAFTSHDFTAYYFNFASDRWDIALEIEADRMVSCSFDPEEFEAEKKVVIEELKTGLDSPWGLLLQGEEADCSLAFESAAAGDRVSYAADRAARQLRSPGTRCDSLRRKGIAVVSAIGGTRAVRHVRLRRIWRSQRPNPFSYPR